VACQILHEDGAFVALMKLAGQVTQPGAGHRDDSLLNGLFARDAVTQTRLGSERDWGLLHRLDRETSGIVLVARTREAYDSIRAQFEARTVEKTYLAALEGRLPSVQGVCTRALKEVRRGEMKVSALVVRGEEARTHWRVLGKSGTHLAVACAIETGRLHQIRAHMASLGAPVVGDRIYRPLLPPNTSARSSGGEPTLRLHAWRIAFAHPTTGARVELEAGLPVRMIEALNASCNSAKASLGVAIERELEGVRQPNWWKVGAKR
jgi:23S rRNA pseudouridine1911/1915/1917 synthase